MSESNSTRRSLEYEVQSRIILAIILAAYEHGRKDRPIKESLQRLSLIVGAVGLKIAKVSELNDEVYEKLDPVQKYAIDTSFQIAEMIESFETKSCIVDKIRKQFNL